MAKWGAALAATVGPAIAAGTAVYSLQQRYGAMADQINDMSLSTGIGVEKIQQMQRAAVLSNTDYGTLEMGLNKLSLAIDAAKDSSSGAAQAFSKLGVTTAGKSLDKVFDETAAALMAMEDTTDRNAAAMAIYGKSWSELLPYMETYIEKKELIRSTPTFSKQELKDLEDAKLAWDDLGNSVTIYTGKALVATQQGVDLLAAMSPIVAGNGRQFLENAQTYRQEQIQKEQQKLKDLLAENAKASTPGVDTAAAGSSDWASALFGGVSTGKGTSTVDLIDNITDAIKEQKDATDDLLDAREKLADIDKDFSRQATLVNPRDAAAVMRLNLQKQWAIEDQQTEIAAAEGRVGETSAGVGKAAGQYAVTINTMIVNGESSLKNELNAIVSENGVPTR
jgi:hypothetical protein